MQSLAMILLIQQVTRPAIERDGEDCAQSNTQHYYTYSGLVGIGKPDV